MAHGFSLLCGMWDLPGPGLEPVFSVLAGGFLTTAPPGKPQKQHFIIKFVRKTGKLYLNFSKANVSHLTIGFTCICVFLFLIYYDIKTKLRPSDCYFTNYLNQDLKKKHIHSHSFQLKKAIKKRIQRVFCISIKILKIISLPQFLFIFIT